MSNDRLATLENKVESMRLSSEVRFRELGTSLDTMNENLNKMTLLMGRILNPISVLFLVALPIVSLVVSVIALLVH